MGLRPEFALRHSAFEPFLQAPLWEEENGSALSILSAFARLGIDPWREAAQLAALPRKEAAGTLAGILSRIPADGFAARPSPLILAGNLVELLPAESEAEAPQQQGRRRDDGRNLGQEGAGQGRSGTGKLRLILVLTAVLVVLQLGGWLL